jgi:hypothetical protein
MKITITFEDDVKGVKVVSDPSYATLMTKMMGTEPTPAVDYALAALNRVKEMSRKLDQNPGAIKPPALVKELEN